GLPVVLQDERGTTVTAYGYLDRTNTYGKKRKAIVDSVAAVIILEDYLRYRRNGL
ncbi:MAG: Holliday junction resolvase RuvX, partial [Clostridia bacterium]|nr:Holliday junction resolvase RuvX [Clostridia bacterium]